MIETFNRKQRVVKSVFEDFCKENFGTDIGVVIYKFFMYFKTRQMNRCENVTPESQQKIEFVKELYKNHGIKNILMGIDIFYKQMRLLIAHYDTHGYGYLERIISTPDPKRVGVVGENAWPTKMSKPALDQFKKNVIAFNTVYNNFIQNENKYTEIIMENFYGTNKVDINEANITEDELKVVVPIQLEKTGTSFSSAYRNYKYKCPECSHVNEVFSLECKKCNIVFDYSEF